MTEIDVKDLEAKITKSIELKFKRREKKLLKMIEQNEKTIASMDKKIKRLEEHIKKNDEALSEAIYNSQYNADDKSPDDYLSDLEKLDAFR